jgi:N-acetylglucosaminyl-diphospho-decaprenol L-rhamnosyltransferase
MGNNPELSIILVSYNTREYTLRALKTVFDETHDTDFEVILVDNDSKDGSLEAVQEAYPQVKAYSSGGNPGFAGGVQFGVARSKGELILLLNPDTLVTECAIDRLVDFAHKHPRNGIWGGVTLNNDRTVNTQHAWARHDFLSLLFSALGLSKIFNKSCFFNKNNYGCWDRTTVKEVDILSGCFFLTPRTLWDQLGGLDPSFFMYAEEADYCLRAKKLGYQPIVTPDARIVHHGGVSHANFSGKTIKLLRGKVELILRHDRGVFQKMYIFLLYLYVLNKMVECRLSKAGDDEVQEWKKIYESRSVWMKGYR